MGSLLHQDYDINVLGTIQDHVMYHYISYEFNEAPRNPWNECPIEYLINKDVLIDHLRTKLNIHNLAFFYHRHSKRNNVHIGLAKFSSWTGKWCPHSVFSLHPSEESIEFWATIFNYWKDQDYPVNHKTIGNIFYQMVSLGPNDWNSIWLWSIDPNKI